MNILQNPTEVAAQRGYPSTLFGFMPQERHYWHEPGLPWFTADLYEQPLLGYNGMALVPRIGDVAGEHMAPRFPKG